MRYVCFLRGINVGGNNIIPMAHLREVFESLGLEKVSTYIQSGNVIFSSGKNRDTLTEIVEKTLAKMFSYHGKIALCTKDELERVISEMPKSWKSDSLRKYVAFFVLRTKPKDLLGKIQLQKGVDEVEGGTYTLYLTSKKSELTKSRLNKLAANPIYKLMTIRNENTCRKVFDLMNAM